MRYRQYNPDQMMLLPPSFQDLIANDSPVWLILELIDEKAVKGLETSMSEEGNAAYNPLMMTRLIVWAYGHKQHSSRQIQRSTYKDVEVMFLCDMQHPNFRTICNFRKENSDFLSKMYKKIYRTAYEMGLTGMLTLSVDGAHLKGNVSGKKGCKRIKQWKEIEKDLDAKIAEYEKVSKEVDLREDREFGREKGIGLSEEYRDTKRRRDRIREVLKKLKGEDEETKVNLDRSRCPFFEEKSYGAIYYGI
jgi:transposase